MFLPRVAVKIVIAVVAIAALGAVVGAIWVGSQPLRADGGRRPLRVGHPPRRGPAGKAEALGWNVAVDEGALRAGPAAALGVTADRQGRARRSTTPR